MIEFNGFTQTKTFDLDQGTDEWRENRCGVITASRAHEIIKTGRKKGSYSEARKAYMNELIAEVCTGIIPESINFKQADWGHLNEPLARDAYEARTWDVVTECGLVYRDESLRCAISPDGLVMDREKGLEIKNPFTTKVHIDTLLYGDIKPEYLTQCQYSIWVTGYKSWDFCSYDHRMRGEVGNRLSITEVMPNEETINTFEREIPLFIEEMDEHLKALGFEFGDQWKQL
jgi:exodeoxyribonuclease (lambda-induced)